MSLIQISNLGPVKNYSERTDDMLLILIGEQTSGKSTVAKMIFFCKSISDEFKKFLMEPKNFTGRKQGSFLHGFYKVLRTKFMEYFGTTKHMDFFEIKYTFDNEENVKIILEESYANIYFSKDLRDKCNELIYTIKEYYQNQEKDFSKKLDLKLWTSQQEKFEKMVDMEVNRIFAQEYTPIFIPAGRSMLSTNSEFFYTRTPNKYDVLMNDFIERIRILQKQYFQKMEDIVLDRIKLSSDEIDFKSVNKAIGLVRKILKGDYIHDKSGEKIYYEKEKFVKLIQASSGQQESLWIVLMLFSVILNHQKVYMVIEEPEAHLFPTAQKEILELIILMIHSTESRVILTTHSPYILTSANLLMYSSYVEQDSKREQDIVTDEFRIANEDVSAYLLKDFSETNIMDRENKMIDASKIDTISEELNIAIDRLLEMEMEHGLH